MGVKFYKAVFLYRFSVLLLERFLHSRFIIRFRFFAPHIALPTKKAARLNFRRGDRLKCKCNAISRLSADFDLKQSPCAKKTGARAFYKLDSVGFPFDLFGREVGLPGYAE